MGFVLPCPPLAWPEAFMMVSPVTNIHKFVVIAVAAAAAALLLLRLVSEVFSSSLVCS